ncbi:LysR family transcriptional regulator, partial [Vibrio parahaemolyticus]|nr:LysR family transcriptional regulator [Vibrio parahaemolyticus]
DLVIRTCYFEDSSLIALHILDSQWLVCASHSYIAKNGKPIEHIDLTSNNCLQYAYQTTVASEWEFKSDEGNYIVRV